MTEHKNGSLKETEEWFPPPLFMDRLDDHIGWIVEVWAYTLKVSPGTYILWSQIFHSLTGFCTLLD